jgi:1-acyl-sn-glycerol-3-phosphate acyltransferase
MSRVLAPFRAIARPVFYGMERVPSEGPLLFVGNHTLFGVLDVPFLYEALDLRKGIVLRGLADHMHYHVPVWRDLLAETGAVDGTRENCARLMAEGESVLVFPGGGREVAKRRGEKYQLLWKERLGFARLAIAHGCTIVPFSAVGVEDAFDIVWDADDLLKTPLGRVFERYKLRTDVLPPIVVGLGPTPLPRPERLYFHLGEPIATGGYDREDPDAPRRLRDQVRSSVQEGIVRLREAQARDPARRLWG